MQSIKIAQMTWKDKFAIFSVKGERLIVKNKKKRIIGLIILVLIILTAGIIIFGYNHINSQKNEKKSLETKSDINKNAKKEKVETIKEEEEQQEESKEEELEKTNETTKIVEENKSNQKITTNHSNNNSNSNSNKTYSAPTNTQKNNNNQQQEIKQEAPKPAVDNRTAWEKLGISEYDYYHTEMYGARVDLYNTDISFCNSEARRILNSYEDVANTRSYSGTGKYTYSYIGCSVDVTFYDGRTVGYNEAKRILGF